MARAGRFDEKAVVVALDEVAAAVGGNHDVCGYWIRKVGAEIAEDWQGRPVLRVGDAQRIVAAFRASKHEHDRQFAAYQAHLAALREEIRTKRQDELRKRREELKRAHDDSARRMAERALQKREAEFATEAAAEHARRGPSFEEWQATHGGTP